MTDQNNQENLTTLIHSVVRDFYAVATTDFLIGHQFRKIQTIEGLNPLTPPLEAFEHHLPRINEFWEIQLLPTRKKPGRPFNLIGVHKDLFIRKGELGRWMQLFYQTLDQTEKKQELTTQEKELLVTWREKIEDFNQRFLKSKVLFSNVQD